MASLRPISLAAAIFAVASPAAAAIIDIPFLTRIQTFVSSPGGITVLNQNFQASARIPVDLGFTTVRPNFVARPPFGVVVEGEIGGFVRFDHGVPVGAALTVLEMEAPEIGFSQSNVSFLAATEGTLTDATLSLVAPTPLATLTGSTPIPGVTEWAFTTERPQISVSAKLSATILGQPLSDDPIELSGIVEGPALTGVFVDRGTPEWNLVLSSRDEVPVDPIETGLSAIPLIEPEPLEFSINFAGETFELQTSADDDPGLAPIPLPLSGWLLLAGLGGIAAVGRRRSA